jgi:dipeptide transport system substrate-binding protein
MIRPRCFLASAILICGALAVTSASAKTLVYCTVGSPENFYPAINSTGISFGAARPIHSRLLEFETGTTKVVPGLAESFEVTPDGKTVTFKLRKGVKFQTTKRFTPTRDFNADDVIFSFARQSDKSNPWFKVTSDNHLYFNDMGIRQTVEVV